MKKVSFNQNLNTVHDMLSPDEYDRSSVKTVLYQKSYNRVTNIIWQRIFQDLNFYKTREMSIHTDNVDFFNF